MAKEQKKIAVVKGKKKKTLAERIEFVEEILAAHLERGLTPTESYYSIGGTNSMNRREMIDRLKEH